MFAPWRYRRFHVSYLVAWVLFGVLLGLWAGQFVALSWTWAIVVALPVGIGAFRSRRWYACVLVVAVGCLLGLARGSGYLLDLSRLSQLAGKEVTIMGAISQDPAQQGDSSTWKVQLAQISHKDTAFKGEVFATVSSDSPLFRGDLVTVHGKANSGFGSFQIAMYRAEVLKVQHSQDVFLSIRDQFAASVRRVVPEPEASLAVGFLLGQKSALPSDLEEQLKVVGLTHLVVASGYNLTILVRFARRLLARHSRYLAVLGSVLLVVGFVAISGMSPSMNRAAAVTALSILAWYYGRKFHPVQLILLVAAGTALWYPVYLWSDLGWLLSFAAFTGVLVVAPIVMRLLWPPERKPGAFSQLLIETLSAELMTLPIIMVTFGYVPVYALLANILVAPVIPFAMASTAVAGVVGFAGGALSVAALPAAIITAFVVAVVEKLSFFPFAELPLTIGWAHVVTWFALVGVFFGVVWARKGVDLAETNVTE